MKLEDLTGDDRTLVVVALQALSGSEVTHIMQTAPPASLQARNHQLRIFWRGGKYFGNSPDGSSPAEMKPDMKSTNENENRRGLLISAGQLLFGERWQTELARALGLSDGRRIRQWLSGDRPIPVGIWDDLRELLEDRSSKMELIVKQIQASKKDKM